MSEYKLDIFKTLSAIDQKNYNYLKDQPDESKKGFAPPVVLKWASCVSNGAAAERQVWLINHRANINFWDIYEHPDLQYRLLASCGNGKNQRHIWINIPAKKKNMAPVYDFMRDIYPYANNRELEMLLSKYAPQEFNELVDSSGYAPEEIKEIKNVYAKFRK